MKRIFLLFAVVMAFGIHQAQAKIPVVYGTLEKINEVAPLPSDYDDEDGSYSLGYKYTMAHLFWVPLWQTDEGKVVAMFKGDDETWIDIDEILRDSDAKEELLRDANISNLSELEQRPFWDAWGGKLVVAAILIVVLFGLFSKSQKNEKKETSAA